MALIKRFFLRIFETKIIDFKLRHCKTVDDVKSLYGEPDIILPGNTDFTDSNNSYLLMEALKKNPKSISFSKSIYSDTHETKKVYNWRSHFLYTCIIIDEQDKGNFKISTTTEI